MSLFLDVDGVGCGDDERCVEDLGTGLEPYVEERDEVATGVDREVEVL